MRSLRNQTLIPRYPSMPRLSNTQPSQADRSETHSQLTICLITQIMFTLNALEYLGQGDALSHILASQLAKLSVCF